MGFNNPSVTWSEMERLLSGRAKEPDGGDGPAFSRFDEKVNWLRDEHGLSHGFATAVVHEADLARAHRTLG